MTSDDIVKVVKLLKLTQSENEHEALAALRRANAILKKHDIQWDKFFSRVVKPEPEPVPAPQRGSPAYYGATDEWSEARYETPPNPNLNEEWLRRQRAAYNNDFADAFKYTRQAATAPPFWNNRQGSQGGNHHTYAESVSEDLAWWAFRSKIDSWFDSTPWWSWLRVKAS